MAKGILGAIALVFLSGIMLGQGCGQQKVGGKLAEERDYNPFDFKPGTLELHEAFQVEGSVHGVVLKYCAGCHADDNNQSIPQSPLFALQQPFYAMENIITKVNLAAPEKSAIYKRLVDDNHNCWGDCDENGAVMLAAIKKWAELTIPDALPDPAPELQPETTLAAQLIPAELENLDVGDTLTMEFPMIGVGVPPELADALFKFDIQKSGNSDYQISNLGFTNLPASIWVKDIKILINGDYRTNDKTYTVVDQTVEGPNENINVTSNMIMLAIDGFGVDRLAPTFGKLVMGPRPCQNIQKYQSEVFPILQNLCLSCHNTGTSRNWQIVNDPAQMAYNCSETVRHVNLVRPISSALITAPRDGRGNMAAIGGFIDNGHMDVILDWINSEAINNSEAETTQQQ